MCLHLKAKCRIFFLKLFYSVFSPLSFRGFSAMLGFVLDKLARWHTRHSRRKSQLSGCCYFGESIRLLVHSPATCFVSGRVISDDFLLVDHQQVCLAVRPVRHVARLLTYKNDCFSQSASDERLSSSVPRLVIDNETHHQRRTVASSTPQH